MLAPSQGTAQEIDFSQFGSYTITLEPVPGYESLDFGSVINGEGNVSVDLGDDPGMAVLSITGVKYLDVVVTITKPDALLPIDPGVTDEIPFTTLEAAYANHGDNDYLKAKMMGNLQARFPILERQFLPPGPPPDPPIEGVSPPSETAYIYLWGSINVGNVAAGDYSATIDITVEYN
ncbi:MAG: hypothetical protein U5K31_03955 [Balneolaceae bacterium]|nr:hypothetical protein [Balneolaceae bacterium]